MAIIETLATITIVIVALKILMLFVYPEYYVSKAKKLYGLGKQVQFLTLVVAGVLLWYLNLAGVSIVTIFAVMLFMGCLIAASLVLYLKPLMQAIKPNKILSENWMVILFFLFMLAWGAKVLWF